MAAVDTTPKRPTYGWWRRPTTAGLGPLGTWGTRAAIAALVIGVILVAAVGILVALLWALLVAVTLAGLTVRNPLDHRTAAQKIGVWAAHRRAVHTKSNLYRSGPLGVTGWGTHQLPGLGAATTLTEHSDAYGRPFALLEYPSTGDHVIVVETDPDGDALVADEEHDRRVGHWGDYLAGMGDERDLVGLAVTVESAPDTGDRLRREITDNTDPQGPDLSLAALAEIADTYPAGSPTVRAWVTYTFTSKDPEGGKRTRQAMAQDLATRLPGLAAGLHGTGAGAARPVSAAGLCELVRTAYDPHAVHLFDTARATGKDPQLAWNDAGPAFAQADRASYSHDGADSITWAAVAMPRGKVQSSILSRLLAPTPGVDRKRVTLTYRPMDAATTAKVVEDDLAAAEFRATSGKRGTARGGLDVKAAQAAADAEAEGAGLVNFGLMVTATITSPDGPATDPAERAARLRQLRTTVANLGVACRLRLRIVYGSQDSAFLATLPGGPVQSRHLSVPTALRENL